MKLFEMEGFLRGKCLPGDMKVNETNAEYLVRKFAEAEAKCSALAAENAGLKDFVKTCFRAAADGASLDGADIQELGERLGLFGRETYQPAMHGYICGHEAGEDTVYVMKKIPATDACLNEVRAQAHKEGAHFVANRMLAAWDAGFIDDTAGNAADIARMILTSTEFMADAPEGDFDRSFADGVLEDIAAQLRKVRAAMLQGADGTITNEDTKRVGELVMWVKRLAHSLRKANPDSKLQSDAMDYLSRNGLICVEDILR